MDPSQFAQHLMMSCARVLQGKQWQDPSGILEQAHRLVLQSKEVALGKLTREVVNLRVCCV